VTFVKEELKILRFWISEREKIRVKKEAGKPKPWTKDPMLQNYRFCNVQREHDKVTAWIRTNWREPYRDHPNLYLAMIMARLINWPPALEEIGFPGQWNYKKYLRLLQNRKMRGDQIWTGAYMVTAGGRPVPKEEAVLGMIDAFHKREYRPKRGDSLFSIWRALQNQGVSGMGSFLAAQVVADLKFTPLCASAIDWYDFCAPGPGSMAGMNRLLGLYLLTSWSQPDFQDAVSELMKIVVHPETAQDMQSCLCEFSKYRRGFSRAKYPGAA
jgi:hypothetical protein